VVETMMDDRDRFALFRAGKGDNQKRSCPPEEGARALADHDACILVVDDDPDVCRNMSDILTDLGYWVDTANEGKAALALVRGRTYDLALLDLKMPGMDGLSLYREMSQRSPATAALLITGYPEDAPDDEVRAAGIRGVFRKPVDFPELLAQVTEIVAG
jgi:two-component system, NtrC family, response regulator HydG